MNPIILAGPAVEPIPLAEMKAYLRLDGTEEDELVEGLICAARITVERHARIVLIEQTWRFALETWPEDRTVVLPTHPVLGIADVRVSRDGQPPLDLPPESYSVQQGGDTARLVAGADAPTPAGRPPRIEIDFTCGFGSDAALVPEPLRLAIRRLVAFWFEHRGDEAPSRPPGLPADIQALIAPFRRRRVA